MKQKAAHNLQKVGKERDSPPVLCHSLSNKLLDESNIRSS